MPVFSHFKRIYAQKRRISPPFLLLFYPLIATAITRAIRAATPRQAVLLRVIRVRIKRALRTGIPRSPAKSKTSKITVTIAVSVVCRIRTVIAVTAATATRTVDYPQATVAITANALRKQTATVIAAAITTAGIAVSKKQIE